jgi:ABC-type oligopeptide transport system ATPase subunit
MLARVRSDMSSGSILSVQNVVKTFGSTLRRRGSRPAVDQVSLEVFENEVLAVVGESGCGKSTLARLLLGLETASSGVVSFRGEALSRLDRGARRRFHQEVSVVFQDPSSSLNPRRRIGAAIAAVLLHHGLATRDDVRGHVLAALESVGLNPPADFIDRWPHELSGGQQQRVTIARAMVTRPRLIIADEPLSSLDLSVQAQVLQLMSRLRAQYGVGYVLISHDLNLVESIADRVAVMSAGRMVALGPVAEVLGAAADPVTRSLLDAKLRFDPARPRFRPHRAN